MEEFKANVGTLLTDKKSGVDERVISIVNGCCLTIRCGETKATFTYIPVSELCLGLSKGKFIIPEDQKSYVVNKDKLPEKILNIYEKKRSFINKVEILYGTDYPEVFSKRPKPELDNLVSRYGFSKKHALSIIRIWLQSGMQSSSLVDPRYIVGRQNPITLEYSKKTGRPSDTGILLDDYAAEAFEYGFKQFMSGRLVTIQDAYLDMIAMFYSNPNAGKEGEYIMLPKNQRPTYKQFYYHLKNHFSTEEIEKKLTSDREYRNNKRILSGRPAEDAVRPGDILEGDALEADIYVVSNYDRSQLIGRPVVYMLVDTYTHCVVAVSVTFENNSNLALSSLMINLFEDKNEASNRYNVKIDTAAWPSGFIPHEIRCDRGSDFASDAFQIICNELNIRRVLEEPGFGSMKGTVEQTFRQFQMIFRREFENKGVIQKRHDSTHMKNACITINEFAQMLYLFVVYHNTRASRTLYLDKEMIESGVTNIPIKVWDYGVKKNGIPRIVPSSELDNVYFRLMPKDKATISKAGIIYKGLYYKVIGDPDLLVRVSASSDNAYRRDANGNRLNYMDIRYDPRSVNCLYYEKNGEVRKLFLNTSKSNSFRDMTWRNYLEVRQLKKATEKDYEDYVMNLDIMRRQVVKAISDSVTTGPVNSTDMREARKKESESINFNNAIEGRIGAQVSEQKALPTEELTEHDDTVGKAPQPKADDAVVKPVSEAEPKQEKIDLTSKTAPKGLTFKRKSILDSMQEKENK